MSTTVHEIAVPAALSPSSLADLADRLAAVRDGVAVLRGSPEIFCRGIDFLALDASDQKANERALDNFARCLRSLRRAPAPCIAVVDAPALGGGLGLAAACDVVIATPRARFGLPEALFGLYPAMILAALEERMIPQRARRLALEGASIDANAACALGLVDEIAEDADRAVARWVRTLGRATTEGVTALKNHPPTADRFDAALSAGRLRTAEALLDDAVRARVRAFITDESMPWGDPR
ncbi:MAG: enoyl-CoA hydratase/isomerase family protein [Deltaproteobacteria bacterium]|nr:enoyl-CoA hydratase/isomerase family protein [Deltaproteobacteria bacterium]